MTWPSDFSLACDRGLMNLLDDRKKLFEVYGSDLGLGFCGLKVRKSIKIKLKTFRIDL